MTQNNVDIVGSGIVGSTIAYFLTQQGYDVDIFEKGPDYPYPHGSQWEFSMQTMQLHSIPDYILPPDLRNLTFSGDYQRNLVDELVMVVGGMATKWTGIALRMIPNDFKTKSLYGYGDNWPLTYNDLEAYYCRAEELMGVSGTDTDNPFAPARSKPYPLPPLELSYGDVILAERLHKQGIVLHTTPQAITSLPYDGRPACDNIGAICNICPTGARYSPNHHLQQALKTGRCKVHTNVSVRRIVLDEFGQARALVYQHNDEGIEKEHGAKVIIVAAGAIESARLLLLSKNTCYPDGLGNNGGRVGQNLTFHHYWDTFLHYQQPLYPGEFAGKTAQSHQFIDPPTRGKHGGIKVEFSTDDVIGGLIGINLKKLKTGTEIVETLKQKRPYWRKIGFHAEAEPTSQKYVTLSEKKDRFGDPYVHVHYELSEFDRETYKYAEELLERFATATGADNHLQLQDINNFYSVYHHHGTCRMGDNPQDSVVDCFGKVHNIPNLFVVGASNFVTSSAVNPTLTIAALAVRTADYLMDQVL